jgi:hypothetical protein
MKRLSIKRFLSMLAMALLTGWPVSGTRADPILYAQPYDGVSPSAISQTFPDVPAFSTRAFDDFTIRGSSNWLISQVTVFGLETGMPVQNRSVNLQFAGSSNFFDPSPIYSGTENIVNGNLVFTFPSRTSLAPGTYWISGWVDRAETLPINNPGGQWFWLETQPVLGSEYFLHNPGGGPPGSGQGLQIGTDPVPGSVTGNPPADLAFEIRGVRQSAVPEIDPAAMGSALTLLIGSLLVARGRRRRS